MEKPDMITENINIVASCNDFVPVADIEKMILTIRGVQVMIDRDLAMLYGVTTSRLNEQVKRNIKRFPDDFMFQLAKEEFEIWKSQFATSNSIIMGARKRPYAFTANGIAMLSSVLRSETARQLCGRHGADHAGQARGECFRNHLHQSRFSTAGLGPRQA